MQLHDVLMYKYILYSPMYDFSKIIWDFCYSYFIQSFGQLKSVFIFLTILFYYVYYLRLTINYYCIQPSRMVYRVYEFFFETDLTFASRNMIIYICRCNIMSIKSMLKENHVPRYLEIYLSTDIIYYYNSIFCITCQTLWQGESPLLRPCKCIIVIVDILHWSLSRPSLSLPLSAYAISSSVSFILT